MTQSEVVLPRNTPDQTLSIAQLRRQFPVLNQEINGNPLIYLDNAASVQKPQAVIDAIAQCYSGYYANVHRGVHTLSQRASSAFEAVREKTRALINAANEREILFTRGTTESINLVASSFGELAIGAGDEVLVSRLEHHSNIVPWQLLCERKGARLRVVEINPQGELLLDQFESLINSRTRLVAITHLSNALGTLNPVREMIVKAHEHEVPVLIDGAQAIAHLPVDVQALDCDFYAFSSHKIYGPSGVGVLFGKERWLAQMPPYHGGGDMIRSVTFEGTEFADLPNKFEAGTPNIAGVIGFGAALDWFAEIGHDLVTVHEQAVLDYATSRLRQIPGLTIIGEAAEKAGVLSFVLDGIHPHDIGTILDQRGIALRTGHHCAQPVMDFYDLPATARVSFAVYNTCADVDALVAGIEQVQEIFR